ncbi:hypothetical protein ON010_g16491 [Phytophthora cinnamomi]|nr:hypothetical protein ON010_g16491 [Phytophthora cinnamomi]
MQAPAAATTTTTNVVSNPPTHSQKSTGQRAHDTVEPAFQVPIDLRPPCRTDGPSCTSTVESDGTFRRAESARNCVYPTRRQAQSSSTTPAPARTQGIHRVTTLMVDAWSCSRRKASTTLQPSPLTNSSVDMYHLAMLPEPKSLLARTSSPAARSATAVTTSSTTVPHTDNSLKFSRGDKPKCDDRRNCCRVRSTRHATLLARYENIAGLGDAVAAPLPRESAANHRHDDRADEQADDGQVGAPVLRDHGRPQRQQPAHLPQGAQEAQRHGPRARLRGHVQQRVRGGRRHPRARARVPGRRVARPGDLGPVARPGGGLLQGQRHRLQEQQIHRGALRRWARPSPRAGGHRVDRVRTGPHQRRGAHPQVPAWRH